MRKLILLMRVSLDGFVAGPNDDMSWIKDDDEQWKDLFEVLQNVDLFLLGGRMYADYKNYWKRALTSVDVTKEERAYAQLAEKTQHIVFSQTITDAGWENTSVENGPIAEAVTKLKNLPGKNIQIVGGAKFAATLIDAGIVDEYRITINPVLLTAGKSFFHQLAVKQELQLIESKQLGSGLVILVLRPKE